MRGEDELPDEVEGVLADLLAAFPPRGRAASWEPPADFEPWLIGLRRRLAAGLESPLGPGAMRELAGVVMAALPRMPPGEAEEWIRLLRPRIAPHAEDAELVLVELQMAWIQGSYAGSAGRLGDAVEALGRAVELAGRFERCPGLRMPTLLQQLADCLLELDRLDEAEGLYRAAQRHAEVAESDTFALSWGLGRVFYFQDRFPEAFRELRRARKHFDHAEPRWIRRNPDAAEDYKGLGALREDLESMIEECRGQIEP